MENGFVKALRDESNWTRTENGALARKSTSNALVDLFGVIGSLRTRSDGEIIDLFHKAFLEDRLLATKLVFYARDIRSGGLGERRTPRLIWKFLAKEYPEIMRKNLHLVPFFGRWDDLYEFIDTPIEQAMWNYLAESFRVDYKNFFAGKPISLLAKWLKSVNTSSKESRALGKLTAKKFGMPEQRYRIMLAQLRAYTNVVEGLMSRNAWGEINYEAVPSKAMSNYRNAFGKHDAERFGDYIKSVAKGEAKINSGTLYPYELFEAMGFGFDYGANFEFRTWNAVSEEQWKALPNYIEGENNVLVMADTSGSMAGRPICTSVGLALYFAERNKGAFKNVFLTFSTEPSFVTIRGNTLKEKVRNIPAIVANTNLEKAFNLVLETAVNNHVPASEMPKSIIIISDMEIDYCVTFGKKQTFYDLMQDRFARHGYDIPNVVFWNVDSRQNVFHSTSDHKGVQLASGQSPAVFKAILDSVGLTAYEAMLKVLNNPVYDRVKI